MTNSDKSIVIIEATFNANGINTPEFKEYSRRSNANGEAHGGVVIGKYQVTANLGQGDAPQLVLIIQYPNKQSGEQTFTNPEYLAIVALREVAFKEVKILQTNNITP